MREAASADHIDAQEFQAYWDIRFEQVPKLKKIQKWLENASDAGSWRASNNLAEFFLTQTKLADHAELAAKYYKRTADEGCLVGLHWLGVFYHQGKGVGKDVKKAIDLLK